MKKHLISATFCDVVQCCKVTSHSFNDWENLVRDEKNFQLDIFAAIVNVSRSKRNCENIPTIKILCFTISF